jgi:hypothetical protein
MPLSYLKLAQTALICVGVFIQHWQYAHSLLQLFLPLHTAHYHCTVEEKDCEDIRPSSLPSVTALCMILAAQHEGVFVCIKLLHQVENSRRK